MTVDHRQVVVVILLSHKAARVLAEGAHLVLKGLWIANELAFVQGLVDLFHHLIAALHAHTDVYGARLVGNVVLGTDLLQPLSAATAGGHNGMIRPDLPLGAVFRQDHALALGAGEDNIVALHAKDDLYPILQQILLHGVVDLSCLFRAKVANGAIHQLQPGLNGPLANGLHFVRILQALDVGICTELQVDLVRIINGILRQVRTDQGGQIAAYLIA